MQNEKPYVDWINSEPVRSEKRSVGWLLKTMLGVACTVVTAAILFPVFAVAPRHSGKSCASMIRLVGVGLQMYQEDYDGRFPQATVWMDATLPYERSKEVYRCPILDLSHPNDFGHGFNASLSLQVLDKHTAPQKVIVLYDSSDLRWNANAPGRTGAANPPRHAAGDSFGFADGHAKTLKLTAAEE